MALKLKEYEQLVSHIFTRVEEALGTNARTNMRECLEEISDLTDEENTLQFNSDGSVEIVSDDEGDQDDQDGVDIDDDMDE